MPFTYPYPRPALTVDVVALAPQDGRLRVLMIQRGKDPYAGSWALPGGFVDADEDLEDAARRELEEETGLAAKLGPQLGTYGAPGRDPRGHTVSVVYLAWLAGGPVELEGQDDAVDARWHDARRPPKLAFDHRQVLRDAVTEIERRAASGLARYLCFLPRTFEVRDAVSFAEAGGRERDGALESQVRRECRATGGVRELKPRAGRLVFRKG